MFWAQGESRLRTLLLQKPGIVFPKGYVQGDKGAGSPVPPAQPAWVYTPGKSNNNLGMELAQGTMIIILMPSICSSKQRNLSK